MHIFFSSSPSFLKLKFNLSGPRKPAMLNLYFTMKMTRKDTEVILCKKSVFILAEAVLQMRTDVLHP
jgi:hypothetical protein